MASPQEVRVWPTLDEYDNALRDALTQVNDPDVRKEKLSCDARPQRLNGQSLKYVSVYKMGGWVVKCFFTNITNMRMPPPDMSNCYQAINDYIQMYRQHLAFLVPQNWVERAITINGQAWPFIKSKFIQAPTLGEFLADRHQEPFVNGALAKHLLEIIKVFESLNIAHGDLDITNVLVSGTYPHVALRLVDFDSMYVPALQGHTMHELGHEHFQAPSQLGIRHFNSEMDRFSALVIYLSLIALDEDSRLWDQCKANEDTKLLLGIDDFLNLDKSSAYNLLRTQHNNRELQLCLDELASSIYDGRTPKSLSDVLSSTPRVRVPTAQLPPLPPHVSPPIWIVVPTAASQPQQLPMPPLTIPIPTSYLQSPSAADRAPSPTPITPSGSRTNPAVWWLLAFAILTGGIAILALQQLGWLLIVTIILLIIMFAVARNKSQ
jgi:hypothetical protein